MTLNDNSKIAHGYIVPHTHWDREWRYPIWKTRDALVGLIDSLLEILDTQPLYRCFVMDGQSVPIEDYLEIRPENAEKVKAYIKSGRIAIGPWFTLPDLYPLDGECLVRNLLKGIRYSQSLGGYQNVGYNSFGWGQTAQFPQIYAGFGIDVIIAAKRVTKDKAPECEFLWEAPDGTQALTTRMGEYTRANFFVNAYIPITLNMTYPEQETLFDYAKSGLIYHRADAKNAYRDFFEIAKDTKYFPEMIKEGVDSAWRATDETTVPQHRLLMDGCDFTSAQPMLSQIVADANAAYQDRDIRHTTLEEYIDVLKASVDRTALNVVKGELREGPPMAVSANALATRSRMKVLNKQVQNALIYVAEPMAAIVSINVADKDRQSFLNKAWDYLLKAHPHDSINGVTQDKTAEDTTYRLNQAFEIADTVMESCVEALLKETDLSHYAPEDILLAIFNPTGAKRIEVLKVSVDTPKDRNIWDFDLEDSLGNLLTTQVVSRKEEVTPLHDPNARPWAFYSDRHELWIDTAEVPAGGLKVLRAVPKKTFDRGVMFGVIERTSKGDDLLVAPLEMRNEFLSVTVNGDGSVDIYDLATLNLFTGLNTYEDAGDVGDYWAYYPPYRDKIFSTRGTSARIWVEDHGPLAATIAVETKLLLPTHAHRPAAGITGESKRSDDEREMTIVTRYTLKRGSKALEVCVDVDNTVEDHRLRVLFPTGIQAESACAAGHFTVDKRPVQPEKNADGEFWPEMQTLPQQTFVDISDGKYGIAFINNCLTEYEAMPDLSRTVALTLFRSVRNMVCTSMMSMASFPDQKGGQSLGKHHYEYALYPHKGGWVEAEVYSKARDFNIPLVPIQTRTHNYGRLPVDTSLYEIVGAKLVMTAFKKSEDRKSHIVRVFNPSDAVATGEFVSYAKILEAHLVSLNEERLQPLNIIDEHRVAIEAGGNKIITIELVFETAR